MAESIDVIIIGAGISGLTVADDVTAAGYTAVVLEARSRCGGRLWSPNGVDLGASWCWPPHERAAADLAAELGVAVLPQRLDGSAVRIQQGESQLLGEVGDRMAPCGGGAVRFKGGYGAIVSALAGKLGHVVHTGCMATAVTKHPEGVEVRYKPDGQEQSTTLQCRRVVLALPPAVLAATIQFDPALPAEQKLQQQDTATWCGDWCKIVARFKTPFWRRQGMSGVIATDGPISIWSAASRCASGSNSLWLHRWEGAAGSDQDECCAALVGLGVGAEACSFVAKFEASGMEATLQEWVQSTLGGALGAQEVTAQLEACESKSWYTDPLTHAHGASGRQYGHPLLRRSTSWGVHFAGTETEDQSGHVQGAIIAGHRAAKEICGELITK